MEHLALYRKYRPTTFGEVIGQDHIIKTLKNQVEQGQVSHAYLFCGTRGTGKTSTAKILSKGVNCLNPKNGSPCLKCEVCKALEDPSNLDILEIDAASNNRVDEIRDLKDKIKYPPVNGKYKVYIIDEVHMLTDSAYNALLKTLEEPPSHAVFILATTEVHKLPATILSRVMRFDFKLISNDSLVELLKTIFDKENITYDKESLKTIAQMGEGSVRDTLSIADVCASFSGKTITYESVLEALGTTTKEVLFQLSNEIITKNSKELLLSINTLFKEGKNLAVLTRDLITYFRDLLLIKTVQKVEEILTMPEAVLSKMKEQALNVKEEELLFYMQKLSAMESELKYATNERLLFETATLACIYEVSLLQSLSSRVEALEKGKVKLTEKKSEAKPAIKQTPKVEPEEVVAVRKEAVKQEEPKEVVEDVNINKIWGQFLIRLNPQTYPVLYTAVIDANPLKLTTREFLLEVDNEIACNILNKQENKAVIETFLKENSLNKAVVIVLKQTKEENKIEQELLKKFGNGLKIIE